MSFRKVTIKISEDKYVEIYEVNGHLYMRDMFEYDGRSMYYSVQEISDVEGFKLYDIRKVTEGPRGEKFLSSSQSLLVNLENDRVIDKWESNLTENSGPASILSVSSYGPKRTVLLGRKVAGDEHGENKYTDARIYDIAPNSEKDHENNCYYKPLTVIVEHRIRGGHNFTGGPPRYCVAFPEDIILYETGLDNVFIIYFSESNFKSPVLVPTNEWALLCFKGDVANRVTLIDCGTQPPLGICELVDNNTGDKYLQVTCKINGGEYIQYYHPATHEVFAEDELPEDVSLVPVEG